MFFSFGKSHKKSKKRTQRKSKRHSKKSRKSSKKGSFCRQYKKDVCSTNPSCSWRKRTGCVVKSTGVRRRASKLSKKLSKALKNKKNFARQVTPGLKWKKGSHGWKQV